MTNDNHTDPYAAKSSLSAVTHIDTFVPEDVQTEVVPETPVEAVPEGSVNVLLDWVGEDKSRAARALTAEEAGANRASAVRRLNGVLDA